MEKDLETVVPKSVSDWRKWLEKNAEKEQAVWVVFYKKASEVPSLTWSEAVSEALCFGWIDSVKKPIDALKYKQFFSKRKANSTWSKVNKDKVTELIAQGKMTASGLRAIEIAKANGSWEFLDQIEALVIPKDLEKRLKEVPEAKVFYEGLSKSNKKSVLYWLASAKREETRAKRLEEIIDCALKKLLPKPFRF